MPEVMEQRSSRAQAEHLAALWHRLSTQHIALGCSCSMSGISVTLEDFERDIADYLWAEAERWGQAGVLAFLQAAGPLAQQERAVRNILQRLAAGASEGSDAADAAVAEWLLARLGKTIESYARLHGPAPDAPLMGGARRWGAGYRD